MFKKTLLLGMFALVPVVAFAQTVTDITTLVQFFLGIIQQLVVLVIAIALLTFLWGMARFIMNAGDKDGVEQGRKLMLWGIVGLFVMVSVWGLVGILQNSFFGGGAPADSPPFGPPPGGGGVGGTEV